MKLSFSLMTHWILRKYPDTRRSFENFQKIWNNIASSQWGVEPTSIKTTTRLRTWARHKKSF